ncbi:MAG: DUF975 family protein [Clostridiales bacterium]|nr:DUF975 family protein [Clostridiales bacterium]
MSFSAIRSAAKQSLRNFWIGALAVYGTLMAVSLLIDSVEVAVRTLMGIEMQSASLFPAQWNHQTALSLGISAAALLIGYLLLTPVEYGRYGWHMELVYGRSPAVREFVRPLTSFKQYVRTLKARLLVILHLIPWGLLIFAPAAIVLLLGCLLPMTGALSGPAAGVMEEWRLPAAGLLLSAGMPFFLTVASSYSLVPYLVMDQEGRTIKEAVGLSKAAMKGNRISYLLFCCSFIGWWLLCLLVLPVLFVAPYFQNAQTVFLMQVLERHEKRQLFVQATQEFRLRPETAAE